MRKFLLSSEIHRSREQSFIVILRGAPTVAYDFSVPDLLFKKFPDLTTVWLRRSLADQTGKIECAVIELETLYWIYWDRISLEANSGEWRCDQKLSEILICWKLNRPFNML